MLNKFSLQQVAGLLVSLIYALEVKSINNYFSRLCYELSNEKMFITDTCTVVRIVNKLKIKQTIVPIQNLRYI